MTDHSEKLEKNQTHRGTPEVLSRQLGVSVHEVLAAIDAAKIEPVENEQGLLEYDVRPVMASVVDNQRIQAALENSTFQALLRHSFANSQASLRQLIREENRTAYQIKQMTESRFLEVLGQLSISLGRVEAFVAQSSRILSQIDMRLARSGDTFLNELVSEARLSLGKISTPEIPIVPQNIPSEEFNTAATEQTKDEASSLTLQGHWTHFEAHLTRVLSAGGQMSEEARKEWFGKVKMILGMGSLELRLNGNALINEIRPVLLNHFVDLSVGLPSEADVLPAFEIYNAWIRGELARGYPAVLLYLMVLLNRGAQVSWTGFLSLFVNEG